MHRTNIYLTDEQCGALDRLARLRGTTRSAVIRDFVMNGLAIEADGLTHRERVREVLMAAAGSVAREDFVPPDRGDSARARYLESILTSDSR